MGVDQDFFAHVTGVARCASPWSCPICAPIIREQRASEIDLAIGSWLVTGHGAQLLTITLPHHRSDALAPRLSAVATSLGYIHEGAAWKRRRDRLGIVGSIRALEVTWGWVNGWHPHAHALVLSERPWTPQERSDYRQHAYDRWERRCASEGFGAPSWRHGIDVRAVTAAGELSTYLTKVEGGWGIGRELARSDTKRSAKGLAPVEILREFVDTGDVTMLRLWGEYELATFGQRSLVWSRGLRDRLGVGQEQSDEELAAQELSGQEVYGEDIARDLWQRAIKSGTTGALLSHAEDQARLVVAR